MSDLITCYGYVSYPGDSLLNITWRFAKHSGASTNHYLSWLLMNNRSNLLHCGINPAHPERIIPKPHVILALMPPLRQYPPVAHHPLHADMALAMSNDKLDMINGYSFHRLINEYELPLMSATAQLTTALQWVRAKARQEAIMGGVGMTLMSAADALSDYTKERAEKLAGKMQEVEAKLKAYLQAPDALKAQAKAGQRSQMGWPKSGGGRFRFYWCRHL